MKDVRKYKGSPDHMITSIKENKMNASKKLYFSPSHSVQDQNDKPKKDSVQKKMVLPAGQTGSDC